MSLRNSRDLARVIYRRCSRATRTKAPLAQELLHSGGFGAGSRDHGRGAGGCWLGQLATAGAGGRGPWLRWTVSLRPLTQQTDGYVQGWAGAVVLARLACGEYQPHRVRSPSLARLVPASRHYRLAGLLRGQPGRRTPQARTWRGLERMGARDLRLRLARQRPALRPLRGGARGRDQAAPQRRARIFRRRVL